MQKWIIGLLFVVSSLPSTASAARSCGTLTVFRPTMVAKRFATWASLELAFGGTVKASAPDEATAKKAVCERAIRADSKCGRVFIVLDELQEFHAVGTHPDGGFWVLEGLGIEQGGTEQSPYIVSVQSVSKTVHLLVQWTEYERIDCTDDWTEECLPGLMELGHDIHWMVDTATGEPKVAVCSQSDVPTGKLKPQVKNGTLKISGCRTEKRNYVISKLPRSESGYMSLCPLIITESDRRAAVKKDVAAGRRLTRNGKYSRAIEAFSRALETDPTASNAYSGRGYALLRKGDYRSAKTDFIDALALTDDERVQGALWYNLAKVAELASDLPAVRLAVARSLKLRPKNKAALRLQAKFKEKAAP